MIQRKTEAVVQTDVFLHSAGREGKRHSKNKVSKKNNLPNKQQDIEMNGNQCIKQNRNNHSYISELH